MAIRTLNERYMLVEYPVTLAEMKGSMKDMPKTERLYYEYAFKALRKDMKGTETIHYFTVADSELTKTGFIVVADSNLYLVSIKMGFFGGAQTEAIPYKNIKSIDFDLAPDPFGLALTNLGILYLEIKGIIESSKRTIRNIPEEQLDNLRKAIQAKI